MALVFKPLSIALGYTVKYRYKRDLQDTLGYERHEEMVWLVFLCLSCNNREVLLYSSRARATAGKNEPGS